MKIIKKNDTVIVITGKYKGLKAKVIEVLTDKQRVRVEGVTNIRHLKPNTRKGNQAGGRIEIVGSVHLSNVLLWSDAANRGIRPKIKETESGKRARFCPKSGQSLEK